MKKKVWIINHYATEQFENKAGRHYWFAKYLEQRGYEPTVFCCNVRHNSSGDFFCNRSLWHTHSTSDGFDFVAIRSSKYSGNGISRIRNMAIFALNFLRMAKQYVKVHDKPDIILASSVHPLNIVAGERVAKRMKVPCIAEVRDLWPESIFAFYPNRKKGIVATLLYAGEKWMYKSADALIFTMEGGWQYLVDKKWDKQQGGFAQADNVHWICNGIDLAQYQVNVDKYSIDDMDLRDEMSFKIIYIGAIRKANGLDRIIECADIMRNSKAKFLLYGDGDSQGELEEQCKKRGLSNVVFKGRIDRAYVPYVLSKANLTLLNYMGAPGVYRYGGSQNKLFQYFAAGKPVLSNNVMNYDLIKRYSCGISREIIEPSEYAAAIQEIMDLPKLQYQQMCKNALRAAADFDFTVLTKKLIDVIEGL